MPTPILRSLPPLSYRVDVLKDQDEVILCFSTGQYRYVRSIETLARVRKLMGVPMVQINIAADGGNQMITNTSSVGVNLPSPIDQATGVHR